MLAITLFGAFQGFGWWQLQRAQQGNDRSWGYVFEWPVFGIFVIVMWIKMIRDEINGVGTPDEEPVEPGRPQTEAEIIREHEAEDPGLAAYNRYLSRLNAETRGSGATGGSA
ncbi:MAG: hypothetical protein JWO67_4989 [Streptosporangiaceae bacterium]|nr:hypothetical protein [Streptosporangiaceae bacterium]